MLSFEFAIVSLLSLAILVLASSFFKKERYADLEQQLDSLTITVMKENYQLKKKMKVLEEELLDPGENIYY